MVKKMVGLNPKQSGQLNSPNPESDKVGDGMKGDVAGPTGNARAIIEKKIRRGSPSSTRQLSDQYE
jgi:hypothetical protein